MLGYDHREAPNRRVLHNERNIYTMERRARGPQKLTPEQEVAMLAALRADTAWRDAKLNAELKIRKQVREEIRKYAEDRDEAIYEAVKAGVPKSRVGKEALRTTSPNVVYEALARYEQEHDLIHEVARYEKPKPRFRWEKLDDLDGGASMWALYDEHTDHVAKFEKWQVDGGWLLADNPLSGKRFWFRGMPTPEALAWVEKNAPGA